MAEIDVLQENTLLLTDILNKLSGIELIFKYTFSVCLVLFTIWLVYIVFWKWFGIGRV